ncbi:hypothetical protein CTRI78_v011261 [Colletotrichum trifolii]|uniref:Uncharacterized protein n=1 Tax=Colletotrichum trifolii TaxID=5466 RepID=A0A4R8QDC8_COLTR|nr:hypothetical protein CTRI78_v011261 [Colletotrichum trifolii]
MSSDGDTDMGDNALSGRISREDQLLADSGVSETKAFEDTAISPMSQRVGAGTAQMVTSSASASDHLDSLIGASNYKQLASQGMALLRGIDPSMSQAIQIWHTVTRQASKEDLEHREKRIMAHINQGLQQLFGQISADLEERNSKLIDFSAYATQHAASLEESRDNFNNASQKIDKFDGRLASVQGHSEEALRVSRGNRQIIRAWDNTMTEEIEEAVLRQLPSITSRELPNVMAGQLLKALNSGIERNTSNVVAEFNSFRDDIKKEKQYAEDHLNKIDRQHAIGRQTLESKLKKHEAELADRDRKLAAIQGEFQSFQSVINNTLQEIEKQRDNDRKVIEETLKKFDKEHSEDHKAIEKLQSEVTTLKESIAGR